MSNSLVSVVIPAYNAERFIVEALDSVFAQTYRPIEVIVVDDGSTDKTAEIVEKYQQAKGLPGNLVAQLSSDPVNQLEHNNSQTSKPATRQTRNRVVPTGEHVNLIYIYQQNSGPSKARNTGIKTAKGDYIAFLDADDLWTTTKLEKQAGMYRKNPDIDIIFTDAKVTRIRDGKTKEFFIFEKYSLKKDFFGHEVLVKDPLEKLLKINFMLTPTVIVKKSCFKNDVYFNEKRKYAEDLELWLKMSLKYTFGYIDEVCVHVNDAEDGLRSHIDQMLLSKIQVLDDFLRENKSGLSCYIPNNKKISVSVKETYKWTGYYFMRHGNKKLARELYKKSMAVSLDIRTLLYYCKTFCYSLKIRNSSTHL